MKRLRIFLAMLANAMLLGMALLVYLDGRNPFMAFLTSSASKVYFLVMCAVGLAVTIFYLIDLRE